MTKPHSERPIRAWRAAIEAAARRGRHPPGPTCANDTVRMRRVATLKLSAHASPVQHWSLLRRLRLFDKATARGNRA